MKEICNQERRHIGRENLKERRSISRAATGRAI